MDLSYLYISLLSLPLTFSSTDSSTSTTAHITVLKSRILSQLGLRDPSFYNRYDIVWPALNPFPRAPRSVSLTPSVLLGMELFGRGMSVHLELKNLTSPHFQTVLLSASGVPYLLASVEESCHYRGRAEICALGVCQEGMAAISLCGEDGGLSGYLKIDGDDVQIKPLPAVVLDRVREASGAHLAKRLEPLEQWDELRELNVDLLESSLQIPPFLSKSSLIQAIRHRYGFLNERDLAVPPDTLTIAEDLATGDGGRLQLEVAVLVDQALANLLLQEHKSVAEQTNAILAAFNAVQVIFDDESFGEPKVRVVVKRVIIDQTGKTFTGDGEAEQYLVDLCQYQDQLASAVGGSMDWDVTVALTGQDIYGVLDDVRKDQMYAGINFPDNRVYGVAGLTYTGGACRAHRNCVVAEFQKGMENVDTIAHELGHAMGMSHDGSGNACSSYSGNIMSLSAAKQRMGWSACSIKNFHEFLSNGKGRCLKVVSDEPRVAAVTNG